MIPQVLIQYPCSDGWDAQEYKPTHRALDFGWLKDISKDGKTPIYACDDGVVEFEGYYTQYFGNKKYSPIGVIIRHSHWSKDKDYLSIYWHLSRTTINKGDVIKRGQEIGFKGDTGNSNGVHLHFQIIEVEKGEAIPDQHHPSEIDRWSSISIDPTSIIEVYDGQIFESVGNFDLQHHKENDEVKVLKAQINALETEKNTLNAMIEQLLDSYVEFKGI